MKRRESITLLGGAAAWPLRAGAQESSELPQICSVHTTRSENSDGFLRRLRDVGYVEGQNVRVDARFTGTAIERLDEVVRELVALKCSVIFASNRMRSRQYESDKYHSDHQRRSRIRSGRKRARQ